MAAGKKKNVNERYEAALKQEREATPAAQPTASTPKTGKKNVTERYETALNKERANTNYSSQSDKVKSFATEINTFSDKVKSGSIRGTELQNQQAQLSAKAKELAQWANENKGSIGQTYKYAGSVIGAWNDYSKTLTDWQNTPNPNYGWTKQSNEEKAAGEGVGGKYNDVFAIRDAASKYAKGGADSNFQAVEDYYKISNTTTEDAAEQSDDWDRIIELAEKGIVLDTSNGGAKSIMDNSRLSTAENAELTSLMNKYGLTPKDILADDLLDKQKEYNQRAVTVKAYNTNVEMTNEALSDPEFEKYVDWTAENREGHLRGNSVDTGFWKWRETIGIANQSDYMTDQQKQIYDYWYAKGGEEAANKYYSTISDSVNSKRADEVVSKAKESGKVAELAAIFATSITAAVENAGLAAAVGVGDLTGNPLYEDYEAPAYSPSQYVTQKAYESYNSDGSVVRKVISDAAQNIGNMLPSIIVGNYAGALGSAAGLGAKAVSTIGKVGGNVAMGANVYGQTYAETMREGYSNSQSKLYAGLVTASELFLGDLIGGISELSQGRLYRIIGNSGSAFAEIAEKMGNTFLGQIWSEAREEYWQEIIDPLLRNMCLGEDNEFHLVTADALYSGLMGGLTAGILDVPTYASRTYADRSNVRLAGQAVQQAGTTNQLKGIGLTFSADSAAYKLASKIDESSKPSQIGKLLSEVSASISDQNASDMSAYLEEKYKLPKESAEKLIGFFRDYCDGVELTKDGLELLDANSEITEAFLATIIDPNVSEARKNSALKALAQNKAFGQEFTSQENSFVSRSKKYNDFLTETVTGKKADADTANAVVTADKAASSKQRIAEVAAKIDKNKSNAENVRQRLTESERVDANAVDTLVDAYVAAGGKQDVATYVNDAELAYTYGKYNMNVGTEAKGNVSSLTDAQMTQAYRLGKAFAGKNVAADVAAVREVVNAAKAKAAETSVAVEPKAGTVTFEYDTNSVKLTERENTSVAAVEALAKGLGLNVVFYESTVGENGKRMYTTPDGAVVSAPNGFYRTSDGSIHLDVHAGYNGNGVVMFAASHELTHDIAENSPADFKKLANFLVEQYGQAGRSVDYYVRAQQNKAKAEGRTLSYKEAFEEFVADSMETMLADGKVAEKLEALKKKDKGLWEKIRDFFKDFVKKLKAVAKYYDGVSPDSAEGRFVASLNKDVIERLQDLFAEGLNNASENRAALMTNDAADIAPVTAEDVAAASMSYRSFAEACGFDAYEDKNGMRWWELNGNRVDRVTLADIEKSPVGALINYSLEAGDLGEGEAGQKMATKQKKLFAAMANFFIKTGDPTMAMQFAGSAFFTAMKSNADAQYGTTYDFVSICTKTQAVVNAMSRAMIAKNAPLTTEEIKEVYNRTFHDGNPVPCPECYVFSHWVGIGGLLGKIQSFQDTYSQMTAAEVEAVYQRQMDKISAKYDTLVEAWEALPEEERKGKKKPTKGTAKSKLIQEIQKQYNKTAEEISKADEKGDVVSDAKRELLKEQERLLIESQSVTWIDTVYFGGKSRSRLSAEQMEKIVNPRYKVDTSILFDLNRGEDFIRNYPEAWKFRCTQGANSGKAITPYADAILGEGINFTVSKQLAARKAAAAEKGERPNNFFLNLNKDGSLSADAKKQIAKARAKQWTQAFIGGQRFQSTSDARYENMSDYLIAMLEMQVMHGMVQVYTKVDGAVHAFDLWGASTNQSLMPKGTGLDENGNIIDTATGGMNPKAAFANRLENEHAGTITIGVNDDHIRAMFNDFRRDQIIPYHASGGQRDLIAEFRRVQDSAAKGSAEAANLSRPSVDYTSTQGDKFLSDAVLRDELGYTGEQIKLINARREARIAILTNGKTGKLDMNVVRGCESLSRLYDRMRTEWNGVALEKKVCASQIFPNEFWDYDATYETSYINTQRYLDYCEDLGVLHRFSGKVVRNGRISAATFNSIDENGRKVKKGLTDLAYRYDENGNITDEIEPFFWKVITDRRMYGNNGQYLPQQFITLNDIDEGTLENFGRNNVGRSYSLENSRKTEAWADKRFKAESKYSSLGEGVRLSSRGMVETQDRLTSEYQAEADRILNMQDTSPRQLIVGYTPDVYQRLGMPSLPLTIGSGHVYSSAKTEAEARQDGNFRKGVHYHGLGGDAVKNIYDAVKDPVMVIAAKDVNPNASPMRSTHSVVAIIDIGTAPNSMLIPIEITAERTVNGKRMDVNTISSVYDRPVGGLITEAIALENSGDVGIFYAKKEASALVSAGVSFPIQMQQSMASDGILHHLAEKVNMKIKKNVQSQQFKRWFGDWQNDPENASKVVNEDGTPKVVYHGTDKEFREFRIGDIGYHVGERAQAEERISDTENGHVIPLYASIRNPLHTAFDFGDWHGNNVAEMLVETEQFEDSDSREAIEDRLSEIMGMERDESDRALREYLQSLGYDGIVYDNQFEGEGESWIAFESSQLKHTEDNIGTYDGSTGDFYLSSRTRLSKEEADAAVEASRQAQLNEIKARQELAEMENKLVDTIIEYEREIKRINKAHDKLVESKDRARMNDIISYEKQLAKLKESLAKKKAELAKARTERDEKIKALREEARQDKRQAVSEVKEKQAVKDRYAKIVGMLNRIGERLVGAKKKPQTKEGVRSLAETVLEEASAYFQKESKVDGKTMLTGIANMYEDLQNSTDDYISEAYREEVHETILEVAAELKDKKSSDLTSSELKELYKVIKAVETTINKAGYLFGKQSSKKTIDSAAHIINDMLNQKQASAVLKAAAPAVRTLQSAYWSDLKPIYAMRRINSPELTELFDALLYDGQSTWSQDVRRAKNFFDGLAEEYKTKGWKMDEAVNYTDKYGNQISLTLNQRMYLYACIRRGEQAVNHLINGGFVYGSAVETKQGKSKTAYLVRDPNAHALDVDTLTAIGDSLSEEQKAYVRKVQTYLSETCGGDGNQVSMEMYGIKMYGEPNYIPIASAGNFHGKAGEVQFEQEFGTGQKLTGRSFTKKTIKNASNPILLQGFTDVARSHIADMAQYHAFAVPLTNLQKVISWAEKKNEGGNRLSVKSAIEARFGSDAPVKYLQVLINDLNNSARRDPTETMYDRALSVFKRSAVMASLSVAIQQPSAIARTLYVLNPKWYAGAKVEKAKAESTWQQLCKYSSTARLKDIGGFDVGMKGSTESYILQDNLTKAQKVKEKINDVSGALPEVMDKITWGTIWNAVKRETKSKYPGLAADSDKFLTAAGARFDGIINLTQVYDSTLTKSQAMRSRTMWMKALTAFTAEPTTGVNMLMDGFQKGGKSAVKAIGAWTASAVLNSLLASVIYAGRDDDDEKTYLEKYASSFINETLESLNPLTSLPFVQDVWNILQGNDVERSDLSLFSDLVTKLSSVVKKIEKGEEPLSWKDYENTVGQLIQMFGIPAKNVSRDVRAIFQTISSAPISETQMYEILSDCFPNLFPSDKGSKLYYAISTGNTEYNERLRGTYENETKYHTAVRSALQGNDPRIVKAAEAWAAGDLAEYKRFANEVKALGFTQDDVVSAVRLIVNEMSKAETESSEYADGKVSMYAAEHYVTSAAQGLGMEDEIFAELVRAYQVSHPDADTKDTEESVRDSIVSAVSDAYAAGTVSAETAEDILGTWYEADAASEKVAQWDYSKSTGGVWNERYSDYYDIVRGGGDGSKLKSEMLKAGTTEEQLQKKVANYARDDFESGEISAAEAEKILSGYGGMTASEADTKVKVWDYMVTYPNTQLDEDDIQLFYNKYEALGVPFTNYEQYVIDINKCGGDTKKAQIMAVIDALPVSNGVKDSLYYDNGYKESTIGEAPWH